MLVLSALLREGPLYSRTLSGASYYVVNYPLCSWSSPPRSYRRPIDLVFFGNRFKFDSQRLSCFTSRQDAQYVLEEV